MFFRFPAERGDDRASILTNGELNNGESFAYALNPTDLAGVEFSFSSLDGGCVDAVDGLARGVLEWITRLLRLMVDILAPVSFGLAFGVEIWERRSLMGGRFTAERTPPETPANFIGVETL